MEHLTGLYLAGAITPQTYVNGLRVLAESPLTPAPPRLPTGEELPASEGLRSRYPPRLRASHPPRLRASHPPQPRASHPPRLRASHLPQHRLHQPPPPAGEGLSSSHPPSPATATRPGSTPATHPGSAPATHPSTAPAATSTRAIHRGRGKTLVH